MMRDRKIDILRFIAMVGIIIAHASAPKLFMQLRGFDVPLMAMLMGMSFYLSNKDREIHYFDYVKKRIKKLTIPTWKFLSLFFLLFFVISLALNESYYFDLTTILTSYLLLSGIGYVWIIGVFLSVALLNPFILKFSNKIRRNSVYFLILGAFYIAYIVLTIMHSGFLVGRVAYLFEHIILYTVSYGIIASIGVRIKRLSNKEIKVATIVSLLIYFILAIANDFSLTSIAKYPPTTYYLSYAIGSIFALYLLLNNKYIFKTFDNKLVYFVSENSLWFYLWHILPVFTLGRLTEQIPFLNNSFVLRFLYLFVVALVLTYLQKMVKDKVKLKKIGQK